MVKRGMQFGTFLAPFARRGDNPSLSLSRNLELIDWLDRLGYDECWIGEHHSGGWETVASPELVIAAAAERTKHIRLGSGVTSLPYHHPFHVAQRFVQLDHQTRGRAMLGCGAGALPSDAYMMGIDPSTQRRRMEEALEAIIALLRCDEPVTRKTDWFELNEARLHLRPYSDPHFPISVTSVMSPSGPITAGRYGVGMLSMAAGMPGGMAAIAGQWQLAEEEAAKAGKTVRRSDWRMVMTVHVAETDEEALRQVRIGEALERVSYYEDVLGRPPSKSEDPLGDAIREGMTLVGSPDTVARGIENLVKHSAGGFGGFLFRAHDWADREQTWRSYELFARWVMPRFQQSLETLQASEAWITRDQKKIISPNVDALRKAYTDQGKEPPAGFESRAIGARKD
jgi:limonene 1,2-monooxygenase